MDPTLPMRTPGMPDEAILRRTGQKVRQRLARIPEAYRLPGEEAEIWAIGAFLSSDECSRLIAMIDKVAKPSAAYDVPYEAGYRTSYSGDLDPSDTLVRQVERRINDLLGVEPVCSETLQGQRYLPGQEFQPHTDWFPAESSYWEAERNRGGQRSMTAMAYLNEVEEGGATSFTELGLTVEPKAGVLLVWNNADRDGLPNPLTMHAGLPVTKGVKYVVTKWYRARPWR